ncbi:conserved hypothetical protein [Neospora caninum Liverpool]|uniref:Transmembrane protein n=1 Tax=Neospora caninum (strain Liverpool) TaxID=572307 RepID=F0VF10_NEOCL|nr:conserved hypothetical protein [Neospora caninum Liverpool]CBZ52304.1 conserved hypothetical protein [Neospora caninum Liverpool]CEL66273.1 TPA: hypothetical protein BN1204_020910 [Neospora caninum Liverpool]|eukprot:XP_003882336.1 conserved hypothetical protein [Neospora caninum Liverpool]
MMAFSNRANGGSPGAPTQTLFLEANAAGEAPALDELELLNGHLTEETKTADFSESTSEVAVPLERRHLVRSRRTHQTARRKRAAAAVPPVVSAVLLATTLVVLASGFKMLFSRVSSAADSLIDTLPAAPEEIQEHVDKTLRQIERLMLDDFNKRYLDANGGAARMALQSEMRRIRSLVRSEDMSDEMYGMAMEQANALQAEFLWKAASTEYRRMAAMVHPLPAGPNTPKVGRWFKDTAMRIAKDTNRVLVAVNNMKKYGTPDDLTRWTRAAAEAAATKKWADALLASKK